MMDEFTAIFGRVAQGVWAAPGRVNVIGEHTDYNDGFVLPIALPQRTQAAAALRQDGRVRLVSRQASGRYDGSVEGLIAGQIHGWARYAAGAIWALAEAGHVVPGLDLLIDSDVPLGAGLSSSAALECAVILAVSDLLGADLDRTTLARLAQRAENDFVGVPTGILDQTASLSCIPGHALFLDVRSGVAEQVRFDPAAHGLALLVIDTRAPHHLADGQYAARRQDCHAAAQTLGVAALRDATVADLDRVADPTAKRRARHVITENDRVLETVGLLREGDVRGIGPVLTQSHASLRDDFEVSVVELDVAVEAALGAGALGGRMTGGGFGGSAIALVPEARVDSCVRAVAQAFADADLAAPAFLGVQPSAGAHQLCPTA